MIRSRLFFDPAKGHSLCLGGGSAAVLILLNQLAQSSEHGLSLRLSQLWKFVNDFHRAHVKKIHVLRGLSAVISPRCAVTSGEKSPTNAIRTLCISGMGHHAAWQRKNHWEGSLHVTSSASSSFARL